MIFLWSDYFVYLLLAMMIIYIIKVRMNPFLLLQWKRLFSKPVNLFSAMILFCYIFIGVIDSIHWKETDIDNRMSTSGIISLLDKILSPLTATTERSYSVPFSIYGFSKESSTTREGKLIRGNPRLDHAGTHLTKPEDKEQDITHRLTYASFASLILWATLSVILLLFAAVRAQLPWEAFVGGIIRGQRTFPWRTFLLTMFFIVFSIVFVNTFMPYYHILGTNQVGEDVLYQSLKSIRTGLIIGTLTTIVTLPFAIFLGVMAGYFRGWIDDVIQYVYTTLSAIPGVLLIVAAVLVMQMVMDSHPNWFETTVQRADVRLLILCLILGITSWTSLCRLLRAEALKLSQMDYVQAAYGLGVSHFKILINHLIPNVMHIILITVALDFSGLVLAEAVLSYVGVGVDPTTYSWGMMINSARLELARVPVVWWSLAAAFVFMSLLVLTANIFSDAVRDMFDPHHKGML